MDTATNLYYDSSYLHFRSAILYEGTDSAQTIYDTTTRYCRSRDPGKTGYYSKLDTFANSLVVYVDALTGTIHTSNDFRFGFHTGSLWTPYEWYRTNEIEATGILIIPAYDYYLKDSRNIETFISEQVGHWYDNNNVWQSTNNVNGSHQESAATAHWAVERAWDYFSDEHGVSFPNVKKIYIPSTGVDLLGQTTSEYKGQPNGGEDRINVVTNDHYRGNGISPSALDVMAHEYTHSMMFRTYGLGNDKNYVDAYALCEGFADIFGMLTESDFRQWTDWTIGEQIGIKRNFFDPWNDYTNQGASPHTATYNDPLWNSSTYVHNRSGVLRRWFNTLAAGQGWTGAGLETAGDLSFVTMHWNLWQNSDYTFARDQTLHVATEHFGGFCGPTWQLAALAWADVGLDPGIQCKPLRLRTMKVIAEDLVGSVAPPKFGVVSNARPGEFDPVTNPRYKWTVPNTWSGHYNTDSSVFILDSAANYDSQPIQVVVNYNTTPASSFSDTFISVVHFSGECNTGSREHNGKLINSPMTGPSYQNDNLMVFPNPNEGEFVISGKLS